MPSIRAIICLGKNGKKYRAEADTRGCFPIKRVGGRTPGWVIALDFVERYLEFDPVLEMDDGIFVRVCQGGKPHIRTEAICAIESHDEGIRGHFRA